MKNELRRIDDLLANIAVGSFIITLGLSLTLAAMTMFANDPGRAREILALIQMIAAGAAILASLAQGIRTRRDLAWISGAAMLAVLGLGIALLILQPSLLAVGLVVAQGVSLGAIGFLLCTDPCPYGGIAEIPDAVPFVFFHIAVLAGVALAMVGLIRSPGPWIVGFSTAQLASTAVLTVSMILCIRKDLAMWEKTDCSTTSLPRQR